jgi:hypothetical protein
MTIVLTTTASCTNLRITTHPTSGPAGGARQRRPWEAAMDAVAALLADPRARLSSPQAIRVLREQIRRVDGTVDGSDVRSCLTDSWKALLALAEAGERDDELLTAGRRLVVVLAEMLCSPIQLPQRHRQCYWELLQAHLRMLSRTTDYEASLQRIDRRFPEWMESLNTVVWCGRIRPVVAASKFPSRNVRRSADEELAYASRNVTQRASCSAPNEAQYLGNHADHWRMHTSHR